jgi:4-hydroxy-3-methylbut-2-en-1-yl diphosphate synthase IspG/GcpE
MAVFGLLSLQVLVPRQFALVCHRINMEWGVKQNHVDVTALPNCGKSHSQIFKLLKPMNECINGMNEGKVMTVQFPFSTFIYNGFRGKSVERK